MVDKMPFMPLRLLFISILIMILAGIRPSIAQEAGLDRGWIALTEAPSVTPEEDRAYRAANALSSKTPQITAPSALFSQSVQAAGDVAELSRALRADVDAVYEFVHDEIAFVPNWGSKKGALGVVLDGSGNAFGQAKLMVELLRQGGLPAADVEYVFGDLRLTLTQIESWYGIDLPDSLSVNDRANVLLNLISSGGTPVGNILFPVGGDFAFDVSSVWVRVRIDGQWYSFDPSLKTTNVSAGEDLASILAASNCTAGDFKTEAQGGGAVVTATSVQSLNDSGVETKLNTCASDLIAYLRQNNPDASLQDVIGGPSITPLGDAQPVRDTIHPFLAPGSTRTFETEIPDSFRARFTVSNLGFAPAPEFFADEISGKRLTISFNASNQAELRLDGALQATGSTLAVGAQAVFALDIDEPYAAAGGNFGDQFGSMVIRGGGTYHILNGWGGSGAGRVDHHRRRLQTERAAGTPDADERVAGETAALVAASWVAEQSALSAIVSQVLGEFSIEHHALGVSGYAVTSPTEDGAPYVDIPFVFSSTLGLDGSGFADATFFSAGAYSSALESGVLEHTIGGFNLSTMSLFELANDQGVTIHKVSNLAEWSAVKPQLVGYGGDCPLNTPKCTIETAIASGETVYLPNDGQLTQPGFDWQGYGYVGIDETQAPAVSVLYAIGQFKGGFAGENQSPTQYTDGTENLDSSFLDNTFKTLSDLFNKSKDPVALFTGDFVYGHDDIAIGSQAFPYGLGFQRSYSSSARFSDRGMGLGWRHNFDIDAIISSGPFQGLGEDSGIDAAALIISAKLSSDLLKEDRNNVLNYVLNTLIVHWGVEQLTDNLVKIARSDNSERFVKLPDGTYNPPPRSSARLTLDGANEFLYETVEGKVLDFNADGKVAEWRDPNGFKVNFTYGGPGGALSQVSNDFGRTLTLSYTDGKVSGVSDGTGRSVSYGYASDNQTSFTDPRSNATTYTYTAGDGLITEIFMPTRPTEAFVTNTYDALGRVKEQRNARNQLYQYFVAGPRTEEIDPFGESTVWKYDAIGNVTQTTDKSGRTVKTSYDGFGRRTRMEMPEGDAVEYEYDDASCNSSEKRCTHNVTTIRRLPKTGPGALVQTFTYEGEAKYNKVKTATDARGAVTTFDYDTAGNLLTITQADPDGAGPKTSPVTTLDYYSTGPITGFLFRQTDPTGVVTESAYDAFGNLTRITEDPSGLALHSCYAFDNRGDEVETADARFGNATCDFGAIANDVTTKTTYDANRNPTRVTAPDPDAGGPQVAPETSFAYDVEDLLIETRSRDGANWLRSAVTYNNLRLTERVYDAVSAPTETGALALAGVPYVETLYDALDRPSERNVFDGALTTRRTQTVYDPDGRVLQVLEAVSTTEQVVAAAYTYTFGNGIQETVADANGNLTTFEYDGYDRLARIRYPEAGNGAVSSATDFEEFTYDANSNVETRRLRSGEIVDPTYDALNRVTFTNMPAGVNDVTYDYDAAGRKILSSVTGYDVSYQFDSIGRLQSVTDDGRTIGYGYDAASNLETMTWPAAGPAPAFTAFYNYDTTGRLSEIREQNGAGVLIASYAYDTLSRRTGVTRGASAGTTTYSYEGVSHGGASAYEPDGALDVITHNYGLTTVTYEMDYNPTGEIEFINTTNAAYRWAPPWDKTVSYGAANGLNQLTTTDGGATAHNANGDLTRLPETRGLMPQPELDFVYDGVSRLIEVANTALYTYGPEGRRTSKTVAGGAVTEYLYSGGQLIAEYDGAGNLLRRYVPGPGADEPVSWHEFGGDGVQDFTRWFYADHLGSIVAVVDDTGQAAEWYSYGPHGEVYQGARPDVSLPGGGSVFRYTGQLYDVETGLSYYKARYYSAALGRFVTTDPIGYSDSLNLYSYVGNDPINFIDPNGLFAEAVANAAIEDPLGFGAEFIPGKGALDGFDDLKRGAYVAGIFNILTEFPAAKVLKLRKVAKAAKKPGSAGIDRTGKTFTPKTKKELDAENAAKNDGINRCENCGIEVVPAQKSQRGVTPPGNQRERDHIIPRSKGGDGTFENGQILCRTCNLKKSDK